MSDSGQAVQKGNTASTTGSIIWRWIRMPIIMPLTWLYSLWERWQSRNNKFTDEVSTREANQNEEFQRHPSNSEQEYIILKREFDQLRARNDDLHIRLSSRDQEVDTLQRECDKLRTRLSEKAAIQLTEGNPNIADLSDQNRPDKLAEQFSELYDNQWTDCYQVLIDDLGKTEEDSTSILLKIVKTSYDICLDECHNILTTTKSILGTFVGRSDEGPDNDLDALMQEILHKLKSHRTKRFKGVPTNISKEIRKKLMLEIGGPETDACDCFIDECIRTCWLMCIKDPPMYIFCDKEAVFDKSKYTEYTERGHIVAYVVWPALYLHKDGPLMKKGVAQGKDKQDREKTGEVNASTSQFSEPDLKQPYKNSTEHTMKDESQEQEKETYTSEGAVNVDDIKMDVTADNSNIDKQESKGNERRNDNASCSSGPNGDNINSSGHVTTEKVIQDSRKDFHQEQTYQSTNVPLLYGNSGSQTNEEGEDNFKFATKDEKMESIMKIDSHHHKYIQANTSEGTLGVDESQEKETQEQTSEVAEGVVDIKMDVISDSSSFDRQECKGNERRNENASYISGQNGDNICNSGNVPSEKVIRDSLEDVEQEETYKSTNVPFLHDNRWSTVNDEGEENIKFAAKDEKTESIMKIESQHEEKYTHGRTSDRRVSIDDSLKIKTAAISNGDNINDDKSGNANDKQGNFIVDNSIVKQEQHNEYFPASQEKESTESENKTDDKSALPNEYCQNVELSEGSTSNQHESDGNTQCNENTSCSSGQNGGELSVIEAEAAQSVDVHNLPHDNLKDGNEISSPSTTMDESVESKEHVDELFSSDERSRQMELSSVCKLNEEESQRKKTNDGFIESISVQKVMQAADIVDMPSDKNICDSPKDVEQEEELNSSDVGSSSVNNYSSDKEGNDVESSTKDGETESNDHKLQLPDKCCQQRENMNDKNNKDEMVIVCTDGQKENEAVHFAHKPSETNKGDSLSEDEQGNELKSSTNRRNSSDDNKNKDKDNAEEQEIANNDDSTKKPGGEELH